MKSLRFWRWSADRSSNIGRLWNTDYRSLSVRQVIKVLDDIPHSGISLTAEVSGDAFNSLDKPKSSISTLKCHSVLPITLQLPQG